MTGIRVLAAALCAISPAVVQADAPAMLPFSTDGCSLFPDRSLIAKADWCACCLAHDLAYWRGGTAEERLRADRELRQCVQTKTGNPHLAELMFLGVRTGGGPYLFTSYRWGYGWPYGRAYAPLSADEDKQASLLRDRYVATNPALACPYAPAPESARHTAAE